MPGRAVGRHSLASPTLFVVEVRDRDTPLVAIPHPEVQVVVRFGPAAPGGLDIHAFGMQPKARRKIIRAGQRAITARLPLGATASILGAPASALAGRIVPLDELWGTSATQRLVDRLGLARSTREAAAILDHAIASRLALASTPRHAPLALEAAARLAHTSVHAVAADLGLSERHLRRIFRDTVGVSPKSFARLARFHRALQAARTSRHARWATIAVATGYYDQAHLIDEFRAITGVTPPALLAELSRQ